MNIFLEEDLRPVGLFIKPSLVAFSTERLSKSYEQIAVHILTPWERLQPWAETLEITKISRFHYVRPKKLHKGGFIREFLEIFGEEPLKECLEKSMYDFLEEFQEISLKQFPGRILKELLDEPLESFLEEYLVVSLRVFMDESLRNSYLNVRIHEYLEKSLNQSLQDQRFSYKRGAL